MIRKTVYFTAPRQVELREEALPALASLGADYVLVETVWSAISAGTEMLVYQGRFPRDLETDSVISSLRGEFEYPLAYGYANVGKVVEVGKGVEKEWLDRFVFSFQPHTSHFACTTEALFPIPDSCQVESACFLPNMETAVNLVQDGAPILGERVMVFGQGVVGLLTTALLGEFPLDSLVTADCHEIRRNVSLSLGASASLDPNSSDFKEKAKSFLNTGADLSFELSGAPIALDDAISLTRFSGRVIIGSWYGEKKAQIDLGRSFHRSRIKLISSQVSSISPDLSARWDKSRRFDVAWKALERIHPEKWITHQYSIEDAEKAYQMLDEKPQETVQLIFSYNK